MTYDIAAQAHRAVGTSAMADAVIAVINRAAHGAEVGLSPQAPVQDSKVAADDFEQIK